MTRRSPRHRLSDPGSAVHRPVPGEDVAKTNERWIERAVQEAGEGEPGTKVLLAIDGFCEPGFECLEGELLWTMQWCGRFCTCGDLFRGVTTDGNASVAMQLDDGIEQPKLAAAALLDEIASIEEGRLVRREEGILLPFPVAAQIAGPHSITYRLTDEP